MKKLFAIILSIGMLTIGAVNAQEKVTVQLDGNTITFPDAQPFVDVRDRSMVPIRFVSEAMGADVQWINETRTVVITYENDVIQYTIGDMKAYLNNEIHVFDTYGILKEDRTFVPLRFIAEMLACSVDWNNETNTVIILSPGETVKFPEPKITVHYPESDSDKRLMWITIDNYREFERECPYYEFKVDFVNPTQINIFEQYEGAINGWQTYNRNRFVSLTNSDTTLVSVSRTHYTTREEAEKFKPLDGDEVTFKLTVHRKCSNESKEYMFSDIIKLPY